MNPILPMLSSDTIAAISTPRGRGAIGILRVSGLKAISIADHVFLPTSGIPPSQSTPRFLNHGRLIDPEEEETIDEVLLAVMRGPKSYTGEDLVEIQAHGGATVLDRALGVLLAQGARLAKPGEFTQRAFMNGRLSLTQAEAVADLIEARTDTARKLALEALKGEPTRKLERLREQLSDLHVQLNASIDFPTEDIETNDSLEMSRVLDEVGSAIEDLLKTARRRAHLMDGLRTPICGKRNVGKSSLLNRLLGQDRALVTPFPGTTRDTIEEEAVLDGFLLHLVDTAGIGDAQDPVEELGLQRTAQAINDAELALFVVDASQPIDDDDRKVFCLLKDRLGDSIDQRVLLIGNKVDRIAPPYTSLIEFYRKAFLPLEPILVSALTGEGIDLLCTRLAERARRNESDLDKPGVGAHARQRVLLGKAAEGVCRAKKALTETLNRPELAAEDVRETLESLEELDGVRVCPDLLDAIFSRFCIGK